MGADLSRSMLIFSKKKKLGKRGLWWLKIHVANKMGKDKLPFNDRVEFVKDNLNVLEKWISDPVKYDEWT